jgi:hypothetical protein
MSCEYMRDELTRGGLWGSLEAWWRTRANVYSIGRCMISLAPRDLGSMSRKHTRDRDWGSAGLLSVQFHLTTPATRMLLRAVAALRHLSVSGAASKSTRAIEHVKTPKPHTPELAALPPAPHLRSLQVRASDLVSLNIS